MLRIVADDKIPFLKGVFEPSAYVQYLPGSAIRRENLLNADALIVRTRTKCNASLLEGTPVKFIATATIGFDHIDTTWCGKNGISWNNAPGCNSSSVQQYIASVLMLISRKEGTPLHNKTLGIVGVGNVGSKIQILARTMGMQVLLNDPPRERTENSSDFVPLSQLIKESDFISLHVPLNIEGIDKTFHLADDAFFDQMKKSAWFINSSRGEVTDSRSLIFALEQGKIKGAALDVWENEPDIDLSLLERVFIGTPHIAGYSYDGKANGTAMVVQACSSFFHIGLDNWYPHDIPSPENSIIRISSQQEEIESIVADAILATYDAKEDDKRLRISPETFEKQRGNYPVRREFQAYSVKLGKSHFGAAQYLMSLGFKII